MSTSKVISIDHYSSSTRFPDATVSGIVSLDPSGPGGAKGTTVLTADKLYPSSTSEDGAIFRALQLIITCIEYLNNALQIDPVNGFIEYDELMMRVKITLRELFALRQLGDGYGSVVNALLWSVTNRNSDPMTRRQLSTVIEVLGELRKRPLIHFDGSMSLLDRLEETDLDTEPALLAALTDGEM